MAWDQRIKRRLKLRDLDTIVVVAQTGSMAKAAGQLSVSQPAISKAIADVERTLGIPLFERTARGVEPTLYGRALIKWSSAVFDDLRQGVNEIAFLGDPTVGHVRVGVTEPLQGGFIPTVIDRITRRHPRITIEVSPATNWADQLQQLRTRNVDLQIGRLMQPLQEDDLEAEALFNDRPSIVASPRHPLAKRRKLELADLVDELWSLPPPKSNVAGRMVAQAFRMQGLEFPKNAVITPSIQVHLGLLATDRYLAAFPASLLQLGRHRMPLKVLPVRWPIDHTPVGVTILKGRTLSPVAQLFIEHSRQVAKSIKEPNPRNHA
jgi:DNA-binding transcriptional LysR family regulator